MKGLGLFAGSKRPRVIDLKNSSQNRTTTLNRPAGRESFRLQSKIGLSLSGIENRIFDRRIPDLDRLKGTQP